MIGMTKSSQALIALDSASGRILWTQSIKQTMGEKGEGQDKVVFSDFFIIETEQGKSEVVVVLSTEAEKTWVISFDPFTQTYNQLISFEGRVIKKVNKIHLSPKKDTLVLLDKDQGVSFYPKISETTANELKYFSISYHSFTDSQLQGQNLNIKHCLKTTTLSHDKVLSDCLTPSWAVNLPRQEILSYSSHLQPEKLYIQTQKPSDLDGAILFKFLESSVFVIGTKISGEKTTQLGVYIIDGSNGRILHQFYESNVNFDQSILLLYKENTMYLTFNRQKNDGSST